MTLVQERLTTALLPSAETEDDDAVCRGTFVPRRRRKVLFQVEREVEALSLPRRKHHVRVDASCFDPDDA